jgi:hypothetical protein
MKEISGSIVVLSGAVIMLASAIADAGDARTFIGLIGLAVTGIGLAGYIRASLSEK